MPHPKELLDSITNHLLPQYPRSEFQYVYEQALNLTDWRNQPDIQIFDATRTLTVAIEIGYTRPEKLKLYVDQRIPDVRWYSKAGELIWTNDSKRLAKEPMVREIKYRMHKQDLWRFVPTTGVQCQVFMDAVFEAQRKVQKMRSSQYAKMRAAIKEARSIGTEHELFRSHCLERFFLHDHDGCWDEINRSAVRDAVGHFYSNGVYAVLVNYCDVCGETTVDYNPSSLLLIEDELESWKRFLSMSYRLENKAVPIESLKDCVREMYAVELDFDRLLEYEPWVLEQQNTVLTAMERKAANKKATDAMPVAA